MQKYFFALRFFYLWMLFNVLFCKYQPNMSFFKKIFGHPQDESSSEKISESNKNYNNIELSLEETFTIEFKKNGGKFLYCENLDELHHHFEDILQENDWFESEAICYEKKLFHYLESNKIQYIAPKNPKFLLSSCENLIATEGSILLSSNQIKEFKPQDLPTNIILIATTSQIITDKTAGLSELHKRYNNGYPSNITTIRYFEKAKVEDFLQYGSVAKNIYLLLLEDL